jgi:hypothetical protein
MELPPALLDHLVDTDVPDPRHGYVLTWDETVERWVATPGGAGLAMLTDDADPLVFLTTEDETDYLVEG